MNTKHISLIMTIDNSNVRRNDMFVKRLYGDEAKKLAKQLGLSAVDDERETDVNTKVTFVLDSIEGHDVLDVYIDV